MKRTLVLSILAAVAANAQAESQPLTYGVRPFYLIDNLEDGALKQELFACAQQTPKKTDLPLATVAPRSSSRAHPRFLPRWRA